MNNLLSGPLSLFHSSALPETEMAAAAGGSLETERFFKEVEAVKEDAREVEELSKRLKEEHERSKTLHSAKAVKDLRASMDEHVAQALKKAKMMKLRLGELDRANEDNRSKPGCGPGSSDDRMRTSVVHALKKKLKEEVDVFQQLRKHINEEYRETVERRYFTLTGGNPDEKTLDLLISTGESETLLQKAVQQQGQGTIMETVSEIQERHGAVKNIEQSLKELHQVFLDMAVLADQQGGELDDIEANVLRAKSIVNRGTHQLEIAKRHQRNTRKWKFCSIVLLVIIIILAILIPVKLLT